MFLGETSTKDLTTLLAQLSRVDTSDTEVSASLIMAVREVEAELQRRGVEVFNV